MLQLSGLLLENLDEASVISKYIVNDRASLF